MQWAIMQICKLCMMSRAVHNSVRYEHRTLVNIVNNLHDSQVPNKQTCSIYDYVFVFDFILITYLLVKSY